MVQLRRDVLNEAPRRQGTGKVRASGDERRGSDEGHVKPSQALGGQLTASQDELGVDQARPLVLSLSCIGVAGRSGRRHGPAQAGRRVLARAFRRTCSALPSHMGGDKSLRIRQSRGHENTSHL